MIFFSHYGYKVSSMIGLHLKFSEARMVRCGSNKQTIRISFSSEEVGLDKKYYFKLNLTSRVELARV